MSSYSYEERGRDYSAVRRPDPRIAARVHAALGRAHRVLNVGAGTGSYEPTDRYVVPVEPSKGMRALRSRELAPAIAARAEALPYDDGAFDAAMAILTVHHWGSGPERAKCLRELRRVTQGPIVVMTFDPDAPTQFWMGDYAPELVEVERGRYGSISSITDVIGGRVDAIDVPIDCTDGFQVAFYARPEAFLRPEVRKAQSAWGFVGKEIESRIVETLRKDLDSGEWESKYGYLRKQPTIRCQLRLIVSP